MPRNFRTAGLAGLILAAFAILPANPTTRNLSGSAQAQKLPDTNATNLNSSRSNIYRGDAPGGTTKKTGKTTKPGKGQERTTTVKSSKSNTSDRTTTVKSSKSNTSD